MRILVVLFLVSSGGVVAALAIPDLADLVLIAGPAFLASLYLLIRTRLADRRSTPAVPPKVIVIDGSNVMYWADDTPKIEPVREVVRYLADQGFTPGVVFDANAGYLIAGRYLHDRDFARLLGLPERRVMVVDKGTPADATILAAARDMEARVVTNDRYRDWADQHPHIRERGTLVRGGYRRGHLWLDLELPEPERNTRDAKQLAAR